MATTNELLQDARHVLNGRKRGREPRIERLRAAGVPVDDWSALTAWSARTARDLAATNGYWFRGRAVRRNYGVEPDLPCIGPYGCRIDTAKPRVRDGRDPATWTDEAEERAASVQDDERYSFAFDGLGITGGGYPTVEEAMAEAEATLAREGFTRDPRAAEQAAILTAWRAYAAKYYGQPHRSAILARGVSHPAGENAVLEEASRSFFADAENDTEGICPTCGGSGESRGGQLVCPVCRGTGASEDDR